MNHYERLKVSPEAPPEVIRAAYRALAAKMHPDRKVGDSGPGDQLHDDMAALNASYLVLMDAQARGAYDRMLAETAQAAKTQAPTASRWTRQRPRTQPPPFAPTAAATEFMGPESVQADPHIDVDWLSAQAGLPAPWYRQPGPMAGLMVGGGLLLGGLMWWGLQEIEHWQLDHGRFDSAVAASPGERGLQDAAERAAAQAEAPRPSAPALSKAQLAHMSNDEFLAAMPQLLEGKAAGDDKPLNPGVDPRAVGVAATGPHMLDGPPLALKLAPLQLGKP